MKPAFVRTPGPVPATPPKPPTPPTFSTLLKRFRERAFLSQSKLAERAGLNHSYISRLEDGLRHPSLDVMEALATAMQLTDAEREALQLASVGLPGITSDEAVLLRQWARLSDTGKHAVRAVMAVALGEEVES